MTFGFLHTDALWCSSAMLPWSGALLVKITVLLAAILAVGSLLGPRHASVRHLIATVGLLCLLGLPVLSLGLGFDTAGGLGAGGTLATALTLWGLGAGWLLFRLLADIVALSVQMRRHVARVDAVTCDRARSLASRVGIRRGVQVLYTEDAGIPYTWGLFRPVIVLPRRALHWTRERLDAVLLHELGHVRRKDALATVLCRVACSIFWFHPLVWWVERRAREDAERCCDMLVVNQGFSAARYARDLLAIVRDARAAAVALAPTMATESHLARRITALIEYVPSAYRVGRLAAAAVLAALFIPTVLLAGAALPGMAAPRSVEAVAACAAIDARVSAPDIRPQDQVSEEPPSSFSTSPNPVLAIHQTGEEK